MSRGAVVLEGRLYYATSKLRGRRGVDSFVIAAAGRLARRAAWLRRDGDLDGGGVQHGPPFRGAGLLLRQKDNIRGHRVRCI
jgi:hypothetical protein